MVTLTIFARFVSFLLRVAHDRARQGSQSRDTNAKVDGASVLMDQIVALSKQIAAIAVVKAPTGSAPGPHRAFFRAHGTQQADTVVHAGVNF